MKVWFKKNESGQVLTEYLFVLIILIIVIAVHIQFSVNYIFAHISRYATFMAARSEAVRQGSYSTYLNAMIQAMPQATLNTQSGGLSFTPQGDTTLTFNYQVVNPLPLVAPQFLNPSSISTFSYEPEALPETTTQGVFDNEIH